jgi:hypothetical protein
MVAGNTLAFLAPVCAEGLRADGHDVTEKTFLENKEMSLNELLRRAVRGHFLTYLEPK